MEQHKPGCQANIRCFVIHPDGKCPGPYGICDCKEPKATECCAECLTKILSDYAGTRIEHNQCKNHNCTCHEPKATSPQGEEFLQPEDWSNERMAEWLLVMFDGEKDYSRRNEISKRMKELLTQERLAGEKEGMIKEAENCHQHARDAYDRGVAGLPFYHSTPEN